MDIYLHEETASRSKSLQPIIKQNLLRLIFSWIYLTQSGNNRSQQISTTDSWAKFAVIDLFADMSDSVRKQPVAASFANDSWAKFVAIGLLVVIFKSGHS